jgi:anti-sigma regulatory factor (Ser/Thr protein kinase)
LAEARARLAPDGTAVGRALRLAQTFAVEAGLGASRAADLAMVVEEWAANIVEHGAARPGSLIAVHLRLEPDHVRIAFSDGGRAFDPRAVAFEGPNTQRGGGAGLAMIASLCRLADYVRRGGRNRLVLEMPLP